MATRLYFPATDAAPIETIGFDSNWQATSQALIRKLADTKGTSAIAAGTIIDFTNGQRALDRQYVSVRMAAGVVFTATTHTVKGQLMMREYAANDNSDRVVTCIRIVSQDGTTVRATLIVCSNYGTTLEFINNASHRNHSFISGTGLANSYTTVLGDRLVVEIGPSNASGTTPQASAKWGEDATDLPENNTQTTDGAGWIEFSNTITFAGESNQYSLVVVGASYAFTTAAATITAQRKLVATNAVYAFTEATVTLRKGFKLVTQEAVYAFTPATVNFSVTRKLIVTGASYSLNTASAGIVAQRKLSVTPASYAFATADAGLAKGYRFIITGATYAFTTEQAGITAQRKLLVTGASYSFSTQPATILAQRKLPAVNAVYLFTAQDAGLNFSGGGTVFGVDPAIYSFSAANAGLTVQRKLTVDGAVYNYSGQSVALKAGRILSVQQAVYVFTTQDAGLSSGVLVSTYRMVAVKTKYKFNCRTAKLIGPRRPGLVKLISPTEV